MGAIVQILGALAVLAGFALSQLGVLNPSSRTYLTLNAAGAAVLAVDAYLGEQWGFLLLEGIWALIALWALARSTSLPHPD